MENNETMAVVPFKTDEFVSIINTAPSILKQNEGYRDAIVKEGNRLIGLAETNGMSDELDELMQERQSRIRNRFKECNEARKPITQLLGEISKRFTSLEADIDPASKTNVFFRIQQKRNIWATTKMEEQKAKEAETLKKMAKEKEAISIREQINSAIGELISEIVLTAKAAANNLFESLDLSEETKWEKQIKAIEDNVAPHIFTSYVPPVFFNLHTSEEVSEIIAEEKTQDKFELLQKTFKAELKAYKTELLDKLPSKLAELKEIEEAKQKAAREAAERQEAIEKAKLEDAEKAKRLQAEADEAQRIADSEQAERERIAEERREDEAERLQKEADAKAELAREEAAIQSASQIAEATITHQADLFTEAPKVKESYEIIINNKAAYSLIFQFWFEKEGKSLTPDKIEKKSIAQMKKFCEDYATKNDEKITSPLISYKEIYKAK
ncbi:MAG: hypothetical protein ACOYOV_09040 [Bacteroidales bacterium]